MTVYGQCIFVANVLLAVRFHNHDWISVSCIFLGCLAYLISYSILSVSGLANEIYLLFPVNFNIPLVWLTLLFSLGFVYISEKLVIEMIKEADPQPSLKRTKSVIE